MTLKKIGEGIEKSLDKNVGLVIDGEDAIKVIGKQLYFSKKLLTKYGNIVRAALRDELARKINGIYDRKNYFI